MSSYKIGNKFYAWMWARNKFIVGKGKNHSEAINEALLALASDLATN